MRLFGLFMFVLLTLTDEQGFFTVLQAGIAALVLEAIIRVIVKSSAKRARFP